MMYSRDSPMFPNAGLIGEADTGPAVMIPFPRTYPPSCYINCYMLPVTSACMLLNGVVQTKGTQLRILSTPPHHSDTPH